MSNEEKKRLEEYKQRRTRLILIQSIILGVLSIVVFSLFLIFYNINQTYYVTYTEFSSIDYKVALKDNDIYDEESLGEDYAYVTSLIDTVDIKFNYKLQIDSDKVNYDFIVKADAMLKIVDSTTNVAIYKPVYTLIPETKQNAKMDELSLSIPLSISYDQYNSEVVDFVKTVNLSNTKSNLLINVTYIVDSECEDYSNNNNSHVLTLNIPLNENVIKITESQSIPTTEEKVIACDKDIQKNAVLVSAIVTLVLDIVGLIILIAFIYLTRNTHINYSIKVKKIVNSYKSFIQKINNVFDTTGYQVLLVNSINEMLEIRDTLQSPILMSENEDKTLTQFIIPTINKILYVFEIKIENYDEIYNLKEEVAEECLDEIIQVSEEETKEEIIVESTPILVEGSDVIEIEETEDYDSFSSMQYSYSFEAKLTLSKEEIKNFYKEIIKYIKEYGVKVSRSFKRERVHHGRKLFATFIYRGKTLCVLFPLDPNNEDFSKYRFIDMSEYKKYSNTPSLMRITSSRKVKYVIEILEKLFTANNIKNKNLSVKADSIKKKSKVTLIKEGLIRKINKD